MFRNFKRQKSQFITKSFRLSRKSSRLLILLFLSSICLLGLSNCISPSNSSTEASKIVYPVDANFVNVKHYGAKGDGRTDDTEAIRLAVQNNLMQHRTLFFPSGTYVVSDSIEWRRENGSFGAFLTWQGEGMGHTIIKLKDRSQLFREPNNPQAIVRTGSIGTKDGRGPRAHSNYIFDMSFDVGKGNSGAIGIDFNASNTGAVENVEIFSEDGKGVVGLELTREVGPCLIKNVTVKGFDTGIKVASALYGLTFENIRLEKQNQVGILNDSNVIAVRKLTSLNSVPALINEGDWHGPSVLIDSQLLGGSSENVAINNQSRIFVRNVVVEGYKTAISSYQQQVVTSKIKEFVSSEPISLFDSPSSSLNLPIEETPTFVDRDLNNWANVENYGAKRDDKLDDSDGIQKAIDSGKTTIYFPQGRYNIDKPIIVGSTVRRMIGFNSWIQSKDVAFRFENSIYPIIFERFNFENANLDKNAVENAATQPLTIRHSIGPTVINTLDTNTLFIENVITKPVNIGKGQKLYARQLNSEKAPPEPILENNGGLVWLLGYKTEQGNTVAATLNGGKTEILGGLFYPAQGVKNPEIPVLINDNSSVTAIYREIAFGSTYKIQIEEIRGNELAILKREELGDGNMVGVGLYVGYSSQK